MRKLIAILYFAFSSIYLYGQTSVCSEESNIIYEAFLVDLVDESTVSYIISSSTTLTDIKTFDFDNPKYHGLDTISKTVLDSVGWRAFLSNVNVNSMPMCRIEPGFFKHRKIFYSTSKSRNASNKRTGVKIDHPSTLYFSPVIVSSDKKRALFSVKSYSSPLSSSASVIFLEHFNRKWRVIKSIMLFIS